MKYHPGPGQLLQMVREQIHHSSFFISFNLFKQPPSSAIYFLHSIQKEGVNVLISQGSVQLWLWVLSESSLPSGWEFWLTTTLSIQENLFEIINDHYDHYYLVICRWRSLSTGRLVLTRSEDEVMNTIMTPTPDIIVSTKNISLTKYLLCKRD